MEGRGRGGKKREEGVRKKGRTNSLLGLLAEGLPGCWDEANQMGLRSNGKHVEKMARGKGNAQNQNFLGHKRRRWNK